MNGRNGQQQLLAKLRSRPTIWAVLLLRSSTLRRHIRTSANGILDNVERPEGAEMGADEQLHVF